MTSITKPGMTTNSFAYNGLDTRVGLTDSTGSKTFKRAGVGVTAPVLSDGTANFTPSGEKRGSTKTTFHSALKNSDIQTNSSGAVSASKQFDAFGNQISSSGTWQSQFAYAGGFGYQQDSDTGLKLLGHRYYDSDTGRFLTRDPAKDGKNWYGYCRNNPVSRHDASGLKPGDKFASIAEAVRDAAAEYGQRTSDEEREFGGYIYQNEDGTYSYTAVEGDQGTGEINFGPVPERVVGDWHTHPGTFMESPSGKPTKVWTPDEISPVDQSSFQ